MEYIDRSLWDDSKFILELIEIDPIMYNRTVELRNDRDFAIEAFRRNNSIIMYSYFANGEEKKWVNDKQFVYSIVALDPNNFQYAAPIFRQAKYIFELLRENPKNAPIVDYASDAFRKNEENWIEAIGITPLVMKHLPKDLKNDDFYVKAIKANPSCYLTIDYRYIAADAKRFDKFKKAVLQGLKTKGKSCKTTEEIDALQLYSEKLIGLVNEKNEKIRAQMKENGVVEIVDTPKRTKQVSLKEVQKKTALKGFTDTINNTKI